MSAAASCDLRSRLDDPCGVIARGRCVDCSRAFCASHQAQPWGGGSYSDLCSDCLVKRARREQAWIEAAEAQAAAELARAEDELVRRGGSLLAVSRRTMSNAGGASGAS